MTRIELLLRCLLMQLRSDARATLANMTTPATEQGNGGRVSLGGLHVHVHLRPGETADPPRLVQPQVLRVQPRQPLSTTPQVAVAGGQQVASTPGGRVVLGEVGRARPVAEVHPVQQPQPGQADNQPPQRTPADLQRLESPTQVTPRVTRSQARARNPCP
jgi:hypothetical protein